MLTPDGVMKVSCGAYGRNNDTIKSEIRLLCFGSVDHVTLISCFLLLAKVLLSAFTNHQAHFKRRFPTQRKNLD